AIRRGSSSTANCHTSWPRSRAQSPASRICRKPPVRVRSAARRATRVGSMVEFLTRRRRGQHGVGRLNSFKKRSCARHPQERGMSIQLGDDGIFNDLERLGDLGGLVMKIKPSGTKDTNPHSLPLIKPKLGDFGGHEFRNVL